MAYLGIPKAEAGRPLPMLTVIAIGWCVLAFLGINMGPVGWENAARWGYLPDSRIYDGAYWSLVTSAFVHVEPLHLIFNLYWLWILGGAVERSIGSAKWALLVVAAAFVSSGLQLASGNSGIGFSGVGYAFFGFGWLAGAKYPELGSVVTPSVVRLFILWGVFCVVTTYLGVMNVGNVAHAGGLAFGAAVAWYAVSPPKRWLSGLALLVLASASIVSPIWSPLSETWLFHKAEAAWARQDWKGAISFYRQALLRGGDPPTIWQNLAELYAFTGNREEYAHAVSELKQVDHAAAAAVVKDFGPPDELSSKPNAPNRKNKTG